jgi:cholesterol 25-hydroxylase
MWSEQNSVFLPRLILISLLFVAICLPSLFQPGLSRLYSYLYQSSFYRFSGFETVETIFFYVLIEPLFTYKFGRNPHRRIDVRGTPQIKATLDEYGNSSSSSSKLKVPKMRRPSERMGELLLYGAPLFLMDLTMIKKFAGVPVSDIRASGNYAPVNDQPSALQESVAEPFFMGNWSTSETRHISRSFLLPTLHNFTLSSPLQMSRALPPPYSYSPTSRRLVLEFLTSFIIYDTVFFLLHLALHRVPMLSKIHMPHHQHSEMHPQVTNRLSVAERLSLVLLANFSLNIIGSHVLTRTMFVPAFVYLLVEVHSGLDLVWAYDKILPAGWGSGAKVHARHHRSGSGGLAPFFSWWDRALALWDDSARSSGSKSV